jgi:hypothetical protein
MVTMSELRAAHGDWFTRANKRFFGDRQYKIINYRGKAWLAQEASGWSDMGGGSKSYHWRLRPIAPDLTMGQVVDKKFIDFEDCKEWVKEQDVSGKPVREPKTSPRTGVPKHSWGKLVHQGAGGFLNPPGHPEHEWSVQSVYGDTSSMSLSSAAEHSGDPKAKAAARAKLAGWKPLPLGDPQVQDWIHQVLGYYKGMYVGMDKGMQQSWAVSDLRNMPDADPVLNQDIHAGVHRIRAYYPGFKPTQYDFQVAYWGRKPTRALAVVPQPREAGPPRLTK